MIRLVTVAVVILFPYPCLIALLLAKLWKFQVRKLKRQDITTNTSTSTSMSVSTTPTYASTIEMMRND